MPDPLRARATIVINHLIGMIEDGEPGRELTGVVPLVGELKTLCTQMGYKLSPMHLHIEERDGWMLRLCDTCDPWGGGGSHTLLSKFKLAGQTGDKVREHLERMDYPIRPDNKQSMLRMLSTWRREFEHPLKRQEHEEPPARSADDARLIAENSLTPSVNRLTDRQRGILLTLLEQMAFDRDSRMRTEDIARAAEGPDAKAGGFKRPVADLALFGFTASVDGREGGVWLTDHGRAVAERLKGGPDNQTGAA